jgi:hypothetical protein
MGSALFFVIELKLNTPDVNALAQMFLELLCALLIICEYSLSSGPTSRR